MTPQGNEFLKVFMETNAETTFSREEFASWRLLGVGTEKRCYLHPEDRTKCLKVSTKNYSRQVMMELEYFRFLVRRGWTTPVVPKFLGEFESENCIGFYQEAFLKEDGWMPLAEAYKTPTFSRDEIRRGLQYFVDEIIRDNIVIQDLSMDNIFFRVGEDGRIERVVGVDGYGLKEFLPLARHMHFFGRLKFIRKWERFLGKCPALRELGIRY